MTAPRMIFGLAAIVLTNTIALIGVASNRSGAPLQTIEFSQDELWLMTTAKDDSSVRLRLESAFPAGPDGTYRGFDETKLKELGFDLPSIPDAADNASPLPREAFVVFRFRAPGEEPPAPETRSERAARSPDGAPAYSGPRVPRHTALRLVVADAAPGYEELRRRYPDPQKNPIIRAVVYAHLVYGPPQTGSAESTPRSWEGHVSTLIPPEIHVPLPFSARLAPLKEARQELRRFRVTLHYGKDLEPWVAAVSLP